MKRILALSLCLVMTVVLLVGCSREEKCFFKAEIVEVGTTYVIVCPLDEYSENRASDKISVSGMIGKDDVSVGDIIGIYYNGQIMESYPAQLGGISKIEIYDADGEIRTTVVERME